MSHQQWAVRVPIGYQVGRWRVERGIASGSWSSVYAARRVDAGGEGQPTHAALKFIPTGTLTPRQLSHLAEMTTRELAVHRSVAHHGLIRVFDTLVIDDPEQPALDGGTVLALEPAVESAATALGRAGGAGLPDAPRIIAEICDGLAHLHQAGWVHGDLKPGNVLIMEDGSVRLADFGLAAELDGTHAYLPPGGTPDYVPPERWAEEVQVKGTAVRQTADIWALGVTACQLLTGQLPFPGVTSRARAAAAAAYVEGANTLALPSDLSDQWRQFILDCLAPSHTIRQRHAAAVLHQRALAIIADPDGAAAVSLLTRMRRPPRWMVAAALSAVLVCGAAVAAWRVGALDPSQGGQTLSQPGSESADPAGYSQYFRTDADIPRQYYDLIVQAGTRCPDEAAVTPLLVAAMLKTESDFDPNLSDPANDEYGIARWTPSVLQFYLPADQRSAVPQPPFPPEVSIPAVGAYLCRFAPGLAAVPGDPAVNLAAAYRTSDVKVLEAGGVPPGRPALTDYIARLRINLDHYRPL
ncbi:MAG: protein kinase [Micromonosporaceae bacterium]|nr:protein kinase [Micromonosporaceae bacterium]